MGLDNIKKQIELGNKAIEQFKNQNAIFDEMLTETIKGIPEDQKRQVEEVQALSQRAVNLAKQGKVEEAKTLIKQMQNVRKSNK